MKKILVWVCMPEGEKNLQFHTLPKEFMKTFAYINTKHSNWEQIRVYNKDTNEVLKQYYNYPTKKEFPTDSDF